MAKNILLTFLSDVKVFSGKVSETSYNNVDGDPVHTTNESAARYLKQSGIKFAQIFIMASNLIRSDIKNYSNKSGNSVTHLDYFKKRMDLFLPNVGYTVYNYDENNTGEENLKSVAEMAELIQKYSTDEEIILHADLTGGMRHINMMMLDIIRLLEYSGVKIGKLIYSNFTTKRVEEVQNIYDLFQLISGVEEFINFGSVEALKKYYAEMAISDDLKNLINSMEYFAESIKLCHYGQFKKAIQNLHDAINDFKADSNNVQDILMARLIDKIRKEYSLLIAERGENDIKIIRWCLERGYLQQALTLYTERVPEYVAKNFITVSDSDKKIVSKKLKADNRNYGFYVLNNYLEDDDNFQNVSNDIKIFVNNINKKYFSLIKKSLKDMKEIVFDYTTWKAQLFFGETIPPFLSSDDFIGNENKIRQQLETFNQIWQNPSILLNLSSDELEYVRDIIDLMNSKFEPEHDKFKRRKTLFNSFYNMNEKTLKKFFSPLKVDMKIFRLKYMLNNGIFTISISEEKFLSIMEKYFVVKEERNHSNHARPDEVGKFETAYALRDFMKGGLDEIENV